LAKVSHALIDLEETWQEPLSKTKQPYELMISTFRAIGNNEPNRSTIIKILKELRQFPFQAKSPTGWSDLTQD
jgi:uncharacterized protein (DUF1800 family)